MTWNVKDGFCAEGEIFTAHQPITFEFCPAVRIETDMKLTAVERRRVIDALVKAASVEMIRISDLITQKWKEKTMTNGEKYKTAQERVEAFDKFCKSNATEEGMCMPDCKLFYSQDDGKCYCGHCEFHWLDLEADVEKPLPCPFCGGECLKETKCMKGYRVFCERESCGYVSSWKKTIDDAIAAHNRVAKKCREVAE